MTGFEIKNAICKQPRVSEYVARSLSRFGNVETIDDLRKILETTSYRNVNEPYNIDKHFDAEWVELVMRHFLMEYEDPNEALKKSHLEGWFDVNTRSVIIDHIFRNIQGLEIVRKESTSIAVATRKNRSRTIKSIKERQKIGRRGDGIFRTYNNNMEYGAIEVAKKFVILNSTKQLKDGLKLGKVMHDMLVCLAQQVKFSEEKVRKLQVIGLLHLGLKLQVLRMSSPNGLVSVLKREELHEVPTTVNKIRDLIMHLSSVWRAKQMVIP